MRVSSTESNSQQTLNTRPMCEICLKLAIKISERHHWHHGGILIVNV